MTESGADSVAISVRAARDRAISRGSHILENCPVPLAITSRDHRLLFWSRSFAQIFEELQPVSTGAFLEAYFRLPLPLELIWKQLAGLDTHYKQKVQALFVAPNRADYEVTSRFLPGRDGADDLLIHIFQDNAELAALSRQVLQSQRLESLGKLAGGVAHEFNNLLQAQLITLQILLDRIPASLSLDQDLNLAIALCERGSTLTRQLLAFSKQSSLNRQAMPVNVMLGNAIRLLRRVLGERYPIRLELDPANPVVNADQGAFEQVLTNVCLNSRDAMPGGGTIVIATHLANPPSADSGVLGMTNPTHVEISVTDSGSGISSELLTKVFDPFFTTKERDKGSGLGLAVVHGIIAEHQGTVSLTSQIGLGTTVHIYLPIEARESTPPIPPTPVARRFGVGQPVLVAEDNLLVRQTAVRILTYNGYEVVEVTDGAEALRIIDERGDRLKLALIDIVMPKVSGVEVVKALRSRGSRLPVVLVTGYNPERSALEELTEDPLTGFLAKPYAVDTLLKLMSSMMEEKTP